MAIWQKDFYLIPEEQNVSGKDFNEIVLWNRGCFQKETLDFLNSFLPLQKSWSDHIWQYGDETKTCIKIVHEGDEILEIFVRIDYRAVTYTVLKKILKFARSIDSKFYFNEKIYDITLKNLASIVYN